ncbi:hypothetical protein CRG98_043950 [Punica granatum]|uniref:Retrotransposon Copia-like N-terminal domain-containing protein n=1 Tax=Punica granatum TaxID=22663 RepID=A0A2I0HVE9_PUNGR|nr:hypothetical protein CRG98_043950 [Punica granatum]
MSTTTVDSNSSGGMPPAYILSPSDGLGTQLVSCKLNGRNYNIWSQAMQTAFQTKNKLGFIEGKVQQPAEGEPYRDQWVTCNSMLVSWIFNHLDEDLQNSVVGAKYAKVLWDDLKERFSQGNEARIHQIKTNICLLRQERKSISEYYSKLKSLWDELELYLDLPPCTCEADIRLAAYKEKEKVHQFLIGLNPEFSTVRSQILRAISSRGDGRFATIADGIVTLEPHATNFMNIRPPTSRINEIRREFRQGSHGREENLGFFIPDSRAAFG